MSQRDNIISFGSSAGARKLNFNHSATDVVKSCREVIARSLPHLMNGLFEKLDDSLYEMADKSGSDAKQTAYFDSMREIRKARQQIEEGFVNGILTPYDRFWNSDPSSQRNRDLDLTSPGELSLMAEDDLEESLAISNMISKGENRYHQELYALEQRFSAMFNGAEVTNQNNPIAPDIICNSFYQVIKDQSLEIPVKLVVYKLFDRQVMQYVGGMYDEISILLGQAGILPKLTPKIRRNPVAPSIRRRSGQGPQAEESAEAASPRSAREYIGEDLQTEIFSVLQQLLDERRQLHASAGYAPESGAIPAATTTELLGALSSLQRTNVVHHVYTPGAPNGEADVNVKTALLEHLKTEGGAEEGKSIGKMDDDTIDVIAMLFEFILEDKNLPDAMKALLSRLQIPMLKVAILDKNFFSKKSHPARRLLNTMAQAAISWNEGDGRSKGSLYWLMESLINRILSEFNNEIELFEKISEELETYLDKEARTAQITEERANQVVQGKEQLKLAKQQVSDEIESRLEKQTDVPGIVTSLLRSGWNDVLLLVYLREGPESEAWTKAVGMVEKVLWSVEPKVNPIGRQKLLKLIPELLRELREGLTSISYDQHKMTKLFKGLQKCHIAALRSNNKYGDSAPKSEDTSAPALSENRLGQDLGKREPAGSAPSDSAPVTEIIEEPRPAENLSTQGKEFPGSQFVEEIVMESASSDERNPASSSGKDEFLQQVDALAIGTWLEIPDKEDGSRIRAKLSWKSTTEGSCVFVNRRGMKVAEISSNALAIMLRAGNALILDSLDVPFMDRALGAMMDALKNGEQQPTEETKTKS